MFCSTCFHTAEEGSKFCAQCRQAREAAVASGSDSPSSLPEAPAPTWVSVPASTTSTTRSLSDLDSSLAGPGWQAPPPSPSLLGSAEASDADGFSGNPFGDPPASDSVLPSSAEPSRSALPQPESIGSGSALQQADVQSVLAPAEETDSAEWEGSAIVIEPNFVRGNKQISSILLVGVVLLSVTTVGQAFREPKQPAALAAAPATASADFSSLGDSSAYSAVAGDEHSETAQRFLVSARSSAESGDYDLAASQLQKASQELAAAGAPASEQSQVKLALAQVTYRQGQLDKAYTLAQQLLAEAPNAEVQSFVKALDGQFLQQATALLVSSQSDIDADRFEQARDKVRQASKLLEAHGGNSSQREGARALLARLDDSSRLTRTRPAEVTPEQPTFQRQDDVPEPSQRRRVVRTATLEEESTVPQARPRVSAQPPAEDAAADGPLPMAEVLRERSQQQPPPEAEGQQMPPQGQEAPYQPSPQGRQPAPAAAQPSYSNERSRAGSQDVLPTYRNESGGSAY